MKYPFVSFLLSLILLSRFMMGKKVKSQNDKFSLEKEMKMIAIHLSCRHFIPINNPSTKKREGMKEQLYEYST